MELYKSLFEQPKTIKTRSEWKESLENIFFCAIPIILFVGSIALFIIGLVIKIDWMVMVGIIVFILLVIGVVSKID